MWDGGLRRAEAFEGEMEGLSRGRNRGRIRRWMIERLLAVLFGFYMAVRRTSALEAVCGGPLRV